MSTILYTHSSFAEHDTGEYHPESPDRIRSVWAALEDEAFANLDRRDSPRAERADLIRAHDEAYVDDLLASVPKKGHAYLDPDTVMSPGSGEAALRAAGAVCSAVDAILKGEARNAFCAVRPPGHHAERGRAMGFCLFNSVSVGAERARAVHGLKKVAVIDFDVHHGNGTQHSFQGDPNLFYGSSHQWPAYPGTGRPNEQGVAGNIVNVPLRPGAGSAEFRHAYSGSVLPALEEFGPELLIISAGFDAHAKDPLAQLEVQTEDYGWVTRELLKVADRCCQGRVVSSLEGGYNLQALGASVAQHVKALMTA